MSLVESGAMRQALARAKRENRTVRVYVKFNPEPGVKMRITVRSDAEPTPEDQFGKSVGRAEPNGTFTSE